MIIGLFLLKLHVYPNLMDKQTWQYLLLYRRMVQNLAVSSVLSFIRQKLLVFSLTSKSYAAIFSTLNVVFVVMHSPVER